MSTLFIATIKVLHLNTHCSFLTVLQSYTVLLSIMFMETDCVFGEYVVLYDVLLIYHLEAYLQAVIVGL